MSKLEQLQRTMWEKRPLILSAKEAYELSPHDHHFYMVTWWGDNPTSLSQFEFTGVISAWYAIKITDEPGEPIKTLMPDEWVVVFQ